jgi:hypothetical protein
VQGFAAVAIVFLSLATFGVLIKCAIDANAQAKASEKSAKAAETAASAALAQTQLMISKERARVLVAPEEQHTLIVALIPHKLMGHHKFTLFNIGLTPAINVSVIYRAIANGFEAYTVEMQIKQQSSNT